MRRIATLAGILLLGAALAGCADDTALETPGARATAEAIHIETLRITASATATAIERAQIREASQLERATADDQFYGLLWRALALALGIGAVLTLAQLSRHGAALFFLRRAVLETRSGTLFFAGNMASGYTPQLMAGLASTIPMLEGEAWPSSQASATHAEADTIIVNAGERSYTMDRPTAAETRADEFTRRLALKLMRAAIAKSGPQAQRIPTATQLAMSSSQWQKAIKALGAHVIVKRGRSGGVWCGEAWPTLGALYVALGERRAMLETTPLPRQAELTLA